MFTYMVKSKRKILHFLFLAIVCVAVFSCNKKTEEEETEIAVTPALVAVKNFHIQKNDSVMEKLDTVFFSIDLKSGVIFNADSLPKGTDVTKLVPSITFANTMTKADLVFFKDNETSATTVDYLKNPSDSIDFSSPVSLEVTAQDGVNSFVYTIKVNVHKENPDTLVWDRFSTSSLPSRFDKPVVQKTIYHDDTAYSIIEENNGEYTLSVCKDLNEGSWDKAYFYPGFEPNPQSFTATPSAFYLCNVYGELYTSADLEVWIDTEEKWSYILGAYGDVILGVKSKGQNFYHTQYPQGEDYVETELEEGFPLANSSPLGVVESKWADNATAFLACGLTEGGEISSLVWAYDGSRWAVINSTDLPALEMPMMARYVVYRDTPYVFTQRELDIWLLMGGVNWEGEMNTQVYITYDNGVHWSLAPEGMQLPENFPDLGGADLIVAGYDLSADLSEAWTASPSTKTRTSYTIDGYEITWNCPYLYLFGGYFPYPDNSLNTSIYRGVLRRLTFTPDI